MSKAQRYLAGMLDADKALYERILDTPSFAFHFNALAALAGEADQLRAALATAERERNEARGRMSSEQSPENR